MLRCENHERFYQASASPAWHVVAFEQGHNDVLDDDDLWTDTARWLCPSGSDTEGMRRLTAGMLVALFRASLQGDATAYSYVTSPDAAPIAITVESK